MEFPVKELHEELKNQIIKLKDEIENYDFKIILIYLFFQERTEILDKYGNISDEPLIIDYCADLYLSNKEKEIPSEEKIKEIVERIKDIFLKYMLCSSFENSSPTELPSRIKVDQLFVKRSFFEKIYFEIVTKIIEPYQKDFIKLYGFNPLNVFIVKNRIEEYIRDRVFNKYKDKDIDLYSILDFSIKDINDLSLDTEEIDNILNYFSIECSDNKDFLPRFKNPVIYKPIIKENDKYICFNPLNLIQNMKSVFEKALKKNVNLWSKYCKTRGNVLENITSEKIKKIMPSSEIYSNLKYKIYENNEEKECELDLLIIIDSKLLLIEAKAGIFSERSKYGFKDRITKDINTLIHSAHEQCIRALKYINQNESVRFYNKNIKLDINKDDFKTIDILSVTLENLDIITANIHNILDLNKSVGIFSVSIYDLSIILAILNGPTEFFLYLNRRNKCIEERKIHAHDELDIFETFIHHGLYFNDFEEYDFIDVTNYSDSIEKYFLFGPPKYEKPKLRVHYFIRKIVNELERTMKTGYIEIGIELMSFSYKYQENIFKNIQKISKRGDKKGESDFSVFTNNTSTGITFYFLKEENLNQGKQKIDSYIQYKKKEQKAKRWILLMNVKGTKNIIDEYSIFY